MVRWLAAFVIVLIIPTIFSVFFSYRSIDRVERAKIVSQKLSADSLKREFSRTVNQAHNLYYKVENTISSLRNPESRNYYFEYDLRLSLNTFMAGLGSIQEVYCYFPKIDYVISTAAGAQLEDFIQQRIITDKELLPEVIRREQPYAYHLLFDDDDKPGGKTVYMVKKTPPHSLGSVYDSAVVMIQYDMRFLESQMEHFRSSPRDFLVLTNMVQEDSPSETVADETMELIAEMRTLSKARSSNEFTTELDGVSYKVYVQNVPYSELLLGVGFDQSNMYTIDGLRQATLIALVVNLLLVLWIWTFLFRRSIMPVSRSLDLLDLDSINFNFNSIDLPNESLIPYYVANVKQMRKTYREGAEIGVERSWKRRWQIGPVQIHTL